MKILIKNAKTLSHLIGEIGEKEVTVNVAIENNKILAVNENEIPDQYDREIDAKGLFLSPGLVDPQVHFREPGMEYKEDIESGSRAAIKGGFTAVISMPNTAPTADNPEVVSMMWQRSQSVGPDATICNCTNHNLQILCGSSSSSVNTKIKNTKI